VGAGAGTARVPYVAVKVVIALIGSRPVDVFTPESGAGWGLGLPLAVLGLICCLATPGGPRRWAALVLLLTLAGMITTGGPAGSSRSSTATTTPRPR